MKGCAGRVVGIFPSDSVVETHEEKVFCAFKSAARRTGDNVYTVEFGI